MIYFSADDYGLCDVSSSHIRECIEAGAINKVSVFPNFDRVDLKGLAENKDVRFSLHLNLVEGKCMSDPSSVDLLTDKEGNFKNTFVGLFLLGLLGGKKLKKQLTEEIVAQVTYWRSILPEGAYFCIDGHQHTQMIPVVFKTLVKVLSDMGIAPDYVRIPAEPVLQYIKAPSLYFTYRLTNIIKQWLLNFLWQINKRTAQQYKIRAAYFMGILFSGKMDEKRVNKILPGYIKDAEKNGMDIEVLFHPGYLTGDKREPENVVFGKFYLSENRKLEYDSVMKIFKKEVENNALY